MSKSNVVLLEAGLVNMSDEELLIHMGTLYENIKRLTEEAKTDQELIDLIAAAKDYKDQHYGYFIRLNTLKLKAAREQAKVRNIVFQMPEIP